MKFELKCLASSSEFKVDRILFSYNCFASIKLAPSKTLV